MSVVIPVKDDERILRCVAAVLDVADEAAGTQVIVVDNGSPPGFEATLQRLPPEVTLLRHPHGNPYSARNLGIDHATGDVVFFTDADAVPRRGWIAEGLKAVDDGGDIVSGYSGSIGNSVIADIVQAPFDAFCARHSRGDPFLVNTRNVAVRAGVFDTLRFDGRFARGGDGAFGGLARRAGFRLFYAPEMVADHEHEPDLPLLAAKHVCWGWNSRRVENEHPEFKASAGRMMARGHSVARRTHIPVLGIGATVFWQAGLLVASVAQRLATVLPRPAVAWLTWDVSMWLARRAGWLLYESGRLTQPTPSELLHRRLRRD